MSAIRLSADQNSATIPPVKAVRVRFVIAKPNMDCCRRCHFGGGSCTAYLTAPCMPMYRNDGRNGYWVAMKAATKNVKFYCQSGDSCSQFNDCKRTRQVTRPCGRSNPRFGDLPVKAKKGGKG
jgi:hypothetical protein